MRPQSAADRSTAHMKLSRKQGDDQWLLQYQEQRASAQDPLGLTRAEFEADPGQTTASALRFNTRKSVRQRQLGAAWQHQFGAGQRLELMAYAGTRSVLQYQAIPVATQAPPSHSGGVIDQEDRRAEGHPGGACAGGLRVHEDGDRAMSAKTNAKKKEQDKPQSSGLGLDGLGDLAGLLNEQPAANAGGAGPQELPLDLIDRRRPTPAAHGRQPRLLAGEHRGDRSTTKSPRSSRACSSCGAVSGI